MAFVSKPNSPLKEGGWSLFPKPDTRSEPKSKLGSWPVAWLLVGLVLTADQLLKRSLIAPLFYDWRQAWPLVTGSLLAALLLFIVSPRSTRLAAALILGGALSNGLDRLLLGGVRDYWPTVFGYLNLADLAISTGLLYFLAVLIRRPFGRLPGRYS